jgi:aminopeptidase YwaD
MKNCVLKIFLLFMMFVNGISAQTFIQAYADIANKVSQKTISTNLQEYENLGVKVRGSAQLQNTLDWLKNKYTSYGYTSSQLVEDSYTYTGGYISSTAACKNLIVTKIGTVYPNKYIIVCGHYDSRTGTGTNDNGSGVVSILEMARLLQNVPTEYSIRFINFSGEEEGLFGSKHYVSSVVNGISPKMDIKLVFNLDEVGGDAAKTNNTITCENDTSTSPSTNDAASAAITSELIRCVGFYSPLQTVQSYAYASDYMSFQSNNEVITGFFETNETPHKHSLTDLLVNMDPVYNYNVAKAATGALLHFATASTTAIGSEDFNKDFQVSFFPNPTKEYIIINKGTLTENEYQFSLIDINGKVVLEKTISNPSLIEKVDITTLNGVYLAIFKAGDKEINRKIVID